MLDSALEGVPFLVYLLDMSLMGTFMNLGSFGIPLYSIMFVKLIYPKIYQHPIKEVCNPGWLLTAIMFAICIRLSLACITYNQNPIITVTHYEKSDHMKTTAWNNDGKNLREVNPKVLRLGQQAA